MLGFVQGASGSRGKLVPCHPKCSLKHGENFMFEKMLNFSSLMVLLYVSGHFKQKNCFKYFSHQTKLFFDPSPIHIVFSILKLFTIYQTDG